MLYFAKFKDVKNKLYEVNIITENSSATTKEIVLEYDEPVTITYDADELLSNMKPLSCTINIVSKEYYLDMFSPQKKGVRVIIYEYINNTKGVFFIGYATPNIYSQDFKNLYDTWELECISELSLLKYYDYKPLGSDKSTISAENLLTNILYKICGMSYLNIYVTNSLRLKNSQVDILNAIKLNEFNFFDDDDEKTPWKCDEVLEELMKFLGMTIVAFKEDIYIIDYQYLHNTTTPKWLKYQLYYDSGLVNSNTTFSDTNKTINGDSYRSEGGSIEMNSAYQRIPIEIDMYPIEEIFDDIFDGAEYSGDGVDAKGNKIPYSYEFQSRYVEKTTKSFIGTTIRTKTKTDETTNYKAFYYTYDNSATFIRLGRMAGADRIGVIEFDGDYPSKIEYDDEIYVYTYLTDFGTDKQGVATMYNSVTTDTPDSRMMQKQLLLRSDNVVTINGDEDSYIILNCNYYMGFNSQENYDYPTLSTDKASYNKTNGVPKYMVSGTTAFAGPRLSLKIGDKYYKPQVFTDNTLGSEGTWVDEEVVFYLPVGDDKIKWLDFMEVKNIVNYTMGLDNVQGFACKIPSGTCLNGRMEIGLYTPFVCGAKDFNCLEFQNECNVKLYYNGERVTSYPKYGIIKDFEVEFANKIYQNSNDEDDDVTYENIAEETWAEEYDGIDLKIHTQPSGKKFCYSSVFNASDNSHAIEFTDLGINKSQRQEYNLIEKYYNHLSSPKMKYIMSTDNGFKPYNIISYPTLRNNKKFMLSQQVMNLGNNTSEITIQEF